MSAKDPEPVDRPEWFDRLCQAQCLPPHYADFLPLHVAPLGRRVVSLRDRLGRPVVIGIAGAQGTGKSTLALFIREWLARERGFSCAVLSLDDVYLGSAARNTLAADVHPLLATRGVPGTHDVGLTLNRLAQLVGPNGQRSVRLPVFDKSRDEVAPESVWPTVNAPVDAVLFEGWCVGAQPQDEQQLETPINSLEATEDPDGYWRRYVNDQLRSTYAQLFARLDALVMLRAPSFERVLEWRRLQEQKLRDRVARSEAGGDGLRLQSDEDIARFVMHFERLTRHMLEQMPQSADSVIDVTENHRLGGCRYRDWQGGVGGDGPAA